MTTYRPEPGTQVRVTKCPKGTHTGMVGAYVPGDDFHGALVDFGPSAVGEQHCLVEEVEPVWTVGMVIDKDAMLALLPVGAEVGSGAHSWKKRDQIGRYNWVKTDEGGNWFYDAQVFYYSSQPPALISLPDQPKPAACEVGESVTSEPPIGCTVRIGQGYLRRGLDGDWYDRGDMNRWTWSDLVGMSDAETWPIIQVSAGEGRPPITTPEMREVPLNEARGGDLIVYSGKVREEGGEVYFDLGTTSVEIDPRMSGLTVIRENPGPRPGEKGVATVRGVPNIKVIKLSMGLYASYEEEVSGVPCHDESFVDDFVADGGAK